MRDMQRHKLFCRGSPALHPSSSLHGTRARGATRAFPWSGVIGTSTFEAYMYMYNYYFASFVKVRCIGDTGVSKKRIENHNADRSHLSRSSHKTHLAILRPFLV